MLLLEPALVREPGLPGLVPPVLELVLELVREPGLPGLGQELALGPVQKPFL